MKRISKIIALTIILLLALSFAACGRTRAAYTKEPGAVRGLVYTGEARPLVSAGASPRGKILYSTNRDTGYAEAIPSARDAGTYTVWYRVKAKNKRNDVAPRMVSVTVAPRPVSVRAEDKSSAEGEELLPLTYVSDALLSGDCFGGALSTNADKNVPGVYDITLGDLSAGPNYAIAFVPGKYTVTQQSGKPSVSIDGAVQTFTYGVDDVRFTVKGTDLSGFRVEYSVNGSWTEAAPVNAGSYDVKVSRPADDDHDAFERTISKGLVIDKADYDMSGISFADKTFVYDKTPKSLEITGALPEGVSVACQNNGKTDAGEYTVTAKFSGDANHNAIPDRTAVLKIDPMPVAVRADDRFSRTGGLPEELTWTAEPSLLPGDSFTGALSTDADMNVPGVYDITLGTLSAGPNYAITFEKGAYTVCDKLPVIIEESPQKYTYGYENISFKIKGASIPSGQFLVLYLVGESWTETAPSAVGTYDVRITRPADEDHDALDKTISGGLVIDKADYDMSGVSFPGKVSTYDKTPKSLAISGTPPEGVTVTYENNGKTDAGTYEVVARFTVQDEVNHNGIPDRTAILDIRPKQISVKADNKRTDKGEDLDALTYTAADELCAGDEFTGALATDADKDKAGLYDITLGSLSAGDNYAIVFTKGIYEVYEKPSVNINEDTQRFTYGDGGIKFTVRGTELSGFTVKYHVGEVWQDGVPGNAGSYDVHVTREEDDTYSALDKTITGGLVIEKAAYDLSGIAFEGQTFTYDKTSKSLAITGTLPEGVSVTYVNNEKTDAGTYEVVAKLTGDANHNAIPDMSATLTIEKRAINVTAESKSSRIGEDLVPLSHKVEPALCEGDSFTAGALKTDADKDAAGEYEITADPAFDAGPDYAITFVPGTYAVSDKLTVFIDESRQTFTYGDEGIAFAIKGTELTGFSVRYRKGTEDWQDAAPVDAGSYDVKVTRPADDDYNALDKTITGGLVIEKAAAQLSTAPEAVDLVWTGEPQALVTPGSAEHGTVAYALSEDGPYLDTVPERTEAMEYTVWYTVTGDENHADAAPRSVRCGIRFPAVVSEETGGKTVITYHSLVAGCLTFTLDPDGNKYFLKINDPGAETISLTKNEDGSYSGTSSSGAVFAAAIDSDHSLHAVRDRVRGFGNEHLTVDIIVNGDGTWTETDTFEKTVSIEGDRVMEVRTDESGGTASEYFVKNYTNLCFTENSDPSSAKLLYDGFGIDLERTDAGSYEGSVERDSGGVRRTFRYTVNRPDADGTLVFLEDDGENVWKITVDRDGNYTKRSGEKTSVSVIDRYGVSYSFAGNGEERAVSGSVNPAAREIDVRSSFRGKPVTAVKDEAFSGRGLLDTVFLPDTLESIGRRAFDGTSLKYVIVPSGVSEAGERAFDGSSVVYCEAGSLPEGWDPMWNGSGTSVIWDVSDVFVSGDFRFFVTNGGRAGIGGYSGSAEKLVLPESVTFSGTEYAVRDVAPGAFSGCISLTSVTVPACVENIGAGAFNGCNSLDRVEISDLAAWFAISFGDENANPLICAHNLYLDGKPLTTGEMEIPVDVSVLGDYALAGCDNLEAVIAGESLATVGGRALSGCRALVYLEAGAAPEGWSDDPELTNYVCLYSETPPADTGIFWHWEDGRRTFWPTNGMTYSSIRDENGEPSAYIVIQAPQLGVVVIPSSYDGLPITAIGDDVFSSSPSVRIDLPDTVTHIGNGAFMECGLLSSIALPDGVVSIGENAFAHCGALDSFAVPGSLADVGSYAFFRCGKLLKVLVTDIGSWSAIDFEDEYANPLSNHGTRLYLKKPDSDEYELVTELVIPEGVERIGSYAFACFDGTSVTIPGSVREAGAGAFDDCHNLTTVRTDDLSKWCGTDFEDERANPLNNSKAYLHLKKPDSDEYELVTELVIPADVERIGSYAFAGFNGTSVTIPGSVREAGAGAFADCDNLTIVRTDDLSKWCGTYFEDACANPLSNSKAYLCLKNSETGEYEPLTELVIPEGVERIGSYAFAGFRGSTLTIPAGVSSFGKGAFARCSVPVIRVDTLAHWCAIDFADEFASPMCGGGKLVFDDDVAIKDGKLVIPGSVEHVPDYAFAKCLDIKEIVLEDGVKSIGKGAFNGCRNLETVSIPGSVSDIGSEALYDTKWFDSQNPEDGMVYAGNVFYRFKGYISDGGEITFREGTAGIAGGAFERTIYAYGNDTIRIVIPDSVLHIGERAFYGCLGITKITIGSGVQSVGGGAFAGCAGTLKSVFVASGNARYEVRNGCLIEKDTHTLIVYIGGNAGYDEGFAIDDGTTIVGDGAFMNSDIEDVSIPASVTKIGADAFMFCFNLQTIRFAGTAGKWSEVEKGEGWNEYVDAVVICSDSVTTTDGRPAAAVAVPPTPGDVLYDGTPRELLGDGGTAVGGFMQYRLEGESWSEAVPTATEVGVYEVRYRAVCDDPDGVSSEEGYVYCVVRSKPAGTPFDKTTEDGVTTTTYYTALGDITIVENEYLGTLYIPAPVNTTYDRSASGDFYFLNMGGQSVVVRFNEDGGIAQDTEWAEMESHYVYTIGPDGTITLCVLDSEGRKFISVLHTDNTEEEITEASLTRVNENGSVTTTFLPYKSFGKISVEVSADGTAASIQCSGPGTNPFVDVLNSLNGLEFKNDGFRQTLLTENGGTLPVSVSISAEHGLTVTFEGRPIARIFHFDHDGTLTIREGSDISNTRTETMDVQGNITATAPDGSPIDPPYFE